MSAIRCNWQHCRTQLLTITRMAEEGRKRLNWEWEEIVLACDLVKQNDWRSLDHEDPRVVELSDLLQRMTMHPLEKRLPEFRNPNGVAQKTRNIAQHHPAYTGSPSNGNGLDGKVLERFLEEPAVMHAMAESIRVSVAHSEPPDFPREVGYENESEMEGRYLLRWHAYRERNRSLRAKKIDSVWAGGGSLTCEVCEFDFAQTYGERGQGYIECHHIEPLHVGGEKVRSLKELALLCSNCHRMIHTKPPWLTPKELRETIRRQVNDHQS
jgi:5-methylcytosine-specific restriction enzyme A